MRVEGTSATGEMISGAVKGDVIEGQRREGGPLDRAMSTPVWLAAGRAVIERDDRPAMVVDAQGCIRATNCALAERGTVATNVIIGKPWSEAWTFDADGGKAIAEAMQRAWKDEVAYFTAYVTTADGGTAMCYFELKQLGPVREGVLVVAVFSARLPSRPQRSRPAAGLHYEVDIATRRLRRASSAAGRPVQLTGTCFQAIMGQMEPCEGCPVSKLAAETGDEARAVVPDPSAPHQLKVVTARRLENNQASVTTWTVDDGLMSLLIQAKIDGLAKAAGLSERERGVLDMLLLGRGHAEIATVLGITPRTVKYHQGRMQTKLGIESRLDLLRIVL